VVLDITAAWQGLDAGKVLPLVQQFRTELVQELAVAASVDAGDVQVTNVTAAVTTAAVIRFPANFTQVGC
jgi:hypothetical protein